MTKSYEPPLSVYSSTAPAGRTNATTSAGSRCRRKLCPRAAPLGEMARMDSADAMAATNVEHGSDRPAGRRLQGRPHSARESFPNWASTGYGVTLGRRSGHGSRSEDQGEVVTWARDGPPEGNGLGDALSERGCFYDVRSSVLEDGKM